MIITGMGFAHPRHQITNTFFEGLGIDASAAWIDARTGILNRYSVLSETQLRRLRRGEETAHTLRQKGEVPTIADLAAQAWNELSGRQPSFEQYTPDLLICGTSVPDTFIPSNASLIADRLGWSSVVMDCNTACSSFVTNVQIAHGLMAAGAYTEIAIANPERYTLHLDYSDRRSSFLFGDGAALTVCSAEPNARGLQLVDIIVESDPSGHGLVQIPVHGTFDQNGSRVQKFAIGKTLEVSRKLLAKQDLDVRDIHYFIGHQANLRMLRTACEKLGVSESSHLYNVDTHGNQGGAGAAIVLASHWHRFQPGDLILVAVVGSGLTWGAALFRFK
ncbi:MAG: ketoacyl-ACP synthase III [Zetaproteobacteria bacterium]|nr:ketoacyl-ACP synthase III [Zetaproteobacteria bacterium]